MARISKNDRAELQTDKRDVDKSVDKSGQSESGSPRDVDQSGARGSGSREDVESSDGAVESGQGVGAIRNEVENPGGGVDRTREVAQGDAVDSLSREVEKDAGGDRGAEVVQDESVDDRHSVSNPSINSVLSDQVDSLTKKIDTLERVLDVMLEELYWGMLKGPRELVRKARDAKNLQ